MILDAETIRAIGELLFFLIVLAGGGYGFRELRRRPTNPHSILGEGDETVKAHMDFRATEHSRIEATLAAMDTKLERMVTLLEIIERR